MQLLPPNSIWLRGWKALTPYRRSIAAPTTLRYPPNQVVRPLSWLHGPLAVFPYPNREDAEDLAQKFEGIVVPCIYEPSNLEHLWYPEQIFHNGDIVPCFPSSPIPQNTVLASAVKCLE